MSSTVVEIKQNWDLKWNLETAPSKALTLYENDGVTRKDITDGVFVFTIRRFKDQTDPDLVLSTVNGKITLDAPTAGEFSLNPVSTDFSLTWDTGIYYYDLMFTPTDGKREVVMYGRMKIESNCFKTTD